MNILIIGTGMYVIGRGTEGCGTILPAITEWKRNGGDVDMVLLCGTNRSHSIDAFEKANILQQNTGISINIKTFPNDKEINEYAYRCALDIIEKPACAIVAVPDHLHYKIAKECLEVGLHTLVVKPLTPTVKEAKDLINLSNKNNLYTTVEFHKRYDRQNLKIKEVLASGEIGNPLYFIVEYSQRKNIPLKTFSSWVDKTNVFQYLGVHYVDIIYFITGATPIKLQVQGQIGWLKGKGVDAFDAIHATIQWETRNSKKFISFIHTNWIDPENTSAMSDQRMKVIGTKGRIELNQKYRGVQKVTDLRGVEDINPDFCNTYPLSDGKRSYQGYGIDSINMFLKDVQNIIDGNLKPVDLETKRSTFIESLVSTAVVEAVNKGLEKQGSWVEITF